jgi:ATP-dependent DNA helicase
MKVKRGERESENDEDAAPCSPGVKFLHEHQKDGVRWMCDNEKKGQGGINGDDMGLGKTVQTIEVVIRGVKADPQGNHDTLFVMPKSIMEQWRRELEEKGGLASFSFYDKNRDFDDIKRVHTQGPLIVLTTYETLRSQFESSDHSLLNHHWRRLVLDEGHLCCNLKAKKTQAILAVRVDITWILTGTPVQNCIPEFVTLLYLVTRDETILGYNKFETHTVSYKKSDEEQRGKVLVKTFKAPSNNTIVSLQQLTKRYMIKRSKKQVEQRKKIRGEAISIPTLYRRDRWIDMKDEEKQEYERLYNDLVLQIQHYTKTGNDSAVHILSAITNLRRYCVHPLLLKQDELSQYLSPAPSVPGMKRPHLPTSSKISVIFRDILSILQSKPDDKILVFSQWTSVLNIIQHYLEYLKMPFHRLDGQTSYENRKKGVDDFQSEDGNARIFLMSLKAGGLGLNLTAANHVLICDLYWNEAAEKQAIARVHREGQKKEVYVTRYVMQGEKSMEKLIFDLQKKKNQHVDTICSKGNGICSGNSTELPQLKLFCQKILEKQKKELLATSH